MAFGEKLRQFRVASGLSQQKLADAVGVTRQTIYHYESRGRYCKDIPTVKRLANVLNVSVSELMDEEDYLLMDAQAKGGSDARHDIQMLVARVAAMFAGGELGDEDKDAALRAITDAYWDAKAEKK